MDTNSYNQQLGNGNNTGPTTFADDQIEKMLKSKLFNAGEGADSTQEVISIKQDEFEVPKYMGSKNFQETFGAARKAGLETFEFPKGSGKMFTTELGPATETHYLETEERDAFGEGLRSTFRKGLPEVKLKKFNYEKKQTAPSQLSGMVDTDTAYDTRQAQRKGIVESRKEKRAALKELRLSGKSTKEGRREIKREAAAQRLKALRQIREKGEAQRASGANPRRSAKFDLAQNFFTGNAKMNFKK